MDLATARKKLEKYGQEHLLRYYETLTEEEKCALLSEIEATDFSVLEAAKEAPEAGKDSEVFEPLGAVTISEIEAREEEFRKAGLQAIKDCRTGAVLLAGGQGTRLGFDHPKGMYNMGLTKDLYIFECHMRQLLKVSEEAGALIPLYVMTSDLNHDETVAFFKEHDYFGYDPAFIRFFRQDMAPCTDLKGKVLMKSRSSLALSPNGNGGWFHSLKNAGLLEDIHEKGIEYLSVFAVDNVLQKIQDPCFVGATILSGVNDGAMVVSKAEPEERIGVICKRNGRPSVVEYYEITEDMKTLRDENGTLLYNYGVILNYLFKVSKLEEIVDMKMPVHFAKKKIPYMAEDGTFVKPEEPNGYKYELLVVDMVELTGTCLPFEVDRKKAFAPVKNAVGVDSVESARALLELNGVEL
ncbi:MAG: UDPGP type 1 family protein [Lachnospiraceae bacterium]|nr:UDPGP type 1 family protein [Lachnospiraceae bacterium]